MNHNEHVRLIARGVGGKGGTWADLGSGTGAFTLALRDVIGPGGQIYSVDKHSPSLDSQKRSMDREFSLSKIQYLTADFTEPLELPPLDGILMANSLHYVKDQTLFLTSLKAYLRPEGKVLLVEYNADTGNMWVPYPVSFAKLSSLASQAGYAEPELLATIASDFLHEIYSAVLRK